MKMLKGKEGSKWRENGNQGRDCTRVHTEADRLRIRLRTERLLTDLERS